MATSPEHWKRVRLPPAAAEGANEERPGVRDGGRFITIYTRHGVGAKTMRRTPPRQTTEWEERP